MRNVSDDILRSIGGSREWARSYPVALNLVRNPKTPPMVSQGLVTRLQTRDLQAVARDRGISELVRRQAQRLLNQRTGANRSSNTSMPRQRGAASRRELQEAAPAPAGSPRARVPLRKILDAIEEAEPGRGLVGIYRTEVLPVKTRTIHLLGRKSSARVIHTLLGYEVQASYKRIHCPDMPTARYLKLFSEIGCRSVKLPYDPTLTERLFPELEASLVGVNQAVRSMFPRDSRMRTYVLERVYRLIRSRLRAAQAAAAVPLPEEPSLP